MYKNHQSQVEYIENFISYWGGVVGCKCEKNLSEVNSSESGVICSSCGRTLRILNAMVIDDSIGTTVNGLENIDYDELHGVTVAASKHLGNRWFELIRKKLPLNDQLNILELGAGTGFLSLGLALASSSQLKRYIISEISTKFLAISKNLINREFSEYERLTIDPKLCYLQCSIDDLPIRRNSVDVVVANSVLHHVYDYELALINIRRTLKKGGIAIFSEPVIEGKAFVGFISGLIKEIDERSQQQFFSEKERAALSDLAILSTKDFWFKQAQLAKLTPDDKHLFSEDIIRELALDIGYTEVLIESYDPINDGLKEIMESSFRIMGISIEPLNHYSYLFDLLQKQIINQIPTKICTPHAFIILQN